MTSTSTQARLEAARAWLATRDPAQPLIIAAASTDAAADILRPLPAGVRAVLGWQRSSMSRLVATLASAVLVRDGVCGLSRLGREALCARVIAQASAEGALGYLAAVADGPGLAKALADTIQELRLFDVGHETLAPPLGRLVALYEEQLAALRLADEAVLLEAAMAALGAAPGAIASGTPVLLLDIRVESPRLQRFVAALAARAGEVLATAPAGDTESTDRLAAALGVAAESLAGPQATMAAPLERLQRCLFGEAPPRVDPDEAVSVFSAPGEARECIEIARRIHRLAASGVPFDTMAVLLRTPSKYTAHLMDAFARAEIPAHFTRGVARPHPAGRAFLSLLCCAHERLSVRRFAEYLSLGELPDAGPEGAPPAADVLSQWVPADPEESPALPEGGAEAVPSAREPTTVDPEAPVVSGSLRAPHRWERLLVESSVIAGRERWERRLDLLARELTTRREACGDGDPRAAQLARELADLAALRAFAMPLVAELAALPSVASWGEWLTRLSALATRSLRHPEGVLATLAELAPMSEVGPVGLGEIISVLRRRLTQVTSRPEKARYGSVYVTPLTDVAGLSFAVVFVPGLVEKLFPERVVEDPLLPDRARVAQEPPLPTTRERIRRERQLLQWAAASATMRAVFSYPRLDLERTRPCVPSFYALEVLRAAEGSLPDFQALAGRAEREGAAHIGWPAPEEPAQAIDFAEHDLAVLRPYVRRSGKSERGRGAARYLMDANPHLARALRFRARRATGKGWSAADGLYLPSGRAAQALAAHRLSARSYSPTALQNFAACPYRFFLQAVMRLRPRDEPVEVEAMDPLARGAMIHEIHFRVLARLRELILLPLASAHLEAAKRELDPIFAEVTSRHYDRLAPTIERVWRDSLAVIRADLEEWLERLAAEPEWEPRHFELSFGLDERELHDEASAGEAVTLDCGVRLRGSIDLVERHTKLGVLRATDYKTGKSIVARSPVLFGGETLQPVLYALALEKLFPGAPVGAGRLYFCTRQGEFTVTEVELDDRARQGAAKLAASIGAAMEKGYLVAAPRPGACEWCDYRPVCGGDEERRVKRKEPYAELEKLRGHP